MEHRSARTNVVVIGGDYAGTMAANRLRMRDDLAITLVNPRPQFVERIRLHQLVAGNHQATVDYGSVLGDGVGLVVDTATRINTADRTVEFAARPGIETATELAEQGLTVTLACGGQLAPYLCARGRRSVARVMHRLGVELLESAVVAEVRPGAVVFTDGGVRKSAATIWTAGFGVPGLAAASGLRTDAMGRLLTDETLTSVDDPYVVAAGDCASPSGVPLRMSCQAAGPLGMKAAETVLSRTAGTTPAAIDQASFGACISLGRRTGILQFAHLDDRPVNVSVTGRPVAWIKEAVCRSTLWSLRREARRPGSAIWFKGGSRVEPPVLATSRAELRNRSVR